MGRARVTSPEMEAAYPLGSKVTYSNHGRVALRPTSPYRLGTVEGYANGGPHPHTVCCLQVRWPETKHPAVLHRQFLEPAG